MDESVLEAIVRRRAERAITFHSRLGIFLEPHTSWLVAAGLRLSRSYTRRLGASPLPKARRLHDYSLRLRPVERPLP